MRSVNLSLLLLIVWELADAENDCTAAFRLCEASCHQLAPESRACVLSCARTSALCQQHHEIQSPKSPVSTFAFKDADGQAFLPVGFYQYTVTNELDFQLPATEAVHGMTLTSPYSSTAAPTDQWWTDMTAFLDEAAATGFMVNFQLIGFEKLGNDAGVLANLTAQIKRFKDHPAIMAWYLADEPSGQGIPNTTLLPKYRAIRQADPGGKPVSMVFCTTNAIDYFSMLDIIMVDPYPIPGSPASSVASALANVASLGKPVMMVPQAFGGGENWARGPSRQEERLMTYLGLLHGAKAIQYFVRSQGIFPAPAAWSEIRIMAQEIRVLTPALLGGHEVEASVSAAKLCSVPSTSACADGVVVKAWADRDGSIVVVAANTATSSGPACHVDFIVAATRGSRCSVTAMFDAGGITTMEVVSKGTVTFSDSLRGLATNAYRMVCDEDGAVSTANLNMVYNGGYEIEMNPGTPDGHYLGNYVAGGGFYFGEYRDSVAGHVSLRLTARNSTTGMSLSPYTVPRVNASAAYRFSIWVKGSQRNEVISFRFSDSIFTVTESDSKMDGDGAILVQTTTSWVQKVVQLKSTSDPAKACPYNCRSWLSYQLISAGSVWLDEMSLSQV